MKFKRKPRKQGEKKNKKRKEIQTWITQGKDRKTKAGRSGK